MKLSRPAETADSPLPYGAERLEPPGGPSRPRQRLALPGQAGGHLFVAAGPRNGINIGAERRYPLASELQHVYFVYPDQDDIPTANHIGKSRHKLMLTGIVSAVPMNFAAGAKNKNLNFARQQPHRREGPRRRLIVLQPHSLEH